LGLFRTLPIGNWQWTRPTRYRVVVLTSCHKETGCQRIDHRVAGRTASVLLCTQGDTQVLQIKYFLDNFNN
jgi:hypothetical protein